MDCREIEGKVIKVEWAKSLAADLRCFTCNQDGHTSADHKLKRSRSRSRSPIRSDLHRRLSEEGKELPKAIHGGKQHGDGVAKGQLTGAAKAEHSPSLKPAVTTEARVASDNSQRTEGVISHDPAELPKIPQQTTTISENQPHSDELPLRPHNPTKKSSVVEPDVEPVDPARDRQSSPNQVLPKTPLLFKPTQLEDPQPAETQPLTPPHEPSPEESKETTPKSVSKQTKARSRSPRSPTNSEMTASDGSTFVLTKPKKADPESSKYRCVRCKTEIQKKSIESHVKTKTHQRHA